MQDKHFLCVLTTAESRAKIKIQPIKELNPLGSTPTDVHSTVVILLLLIHCLLLLPLFVGFFVFCGVVPTSVLSSFAIICH